MDPGLERQTFLIARFIMLAVPLMLFRTRNRESSLAFAIVRRDENALASTTVLSTGKFHPADRSGDSTQTK
jgi:hypothetical protein